MDRLDILIDVVLDTCKLTPFLFITYLFLEWMEHKTGNKVERYLQNHTSQAPFIATLFGMIPECGFSSAASTLYVTGVISKGTLIAIFLSTSDEMLPIMIAAKAPFSTLFNILFVKIFVALVAGYAIDSFTKPTIRMKDGIKEEHDEHHSILVEAISRTLKIAIWMFGITLVMTYLIEWIGQESIEVFLSNHQTISILFCSLFGMIPSCASSIALTTMYLHNVIDIAEVCAGLLANSGIGIAILFRVSSDKKDCFKIMILLLAISMGSGLLLKLI